MDNVEPMGYPFQTGFIDLNHLKFESKHLPPDMNFKMGLPQGSLFRVMGAQNNWQPSKMVKNHIYETHAVRKKRTISSAQPKNYEWTEYQATFKKSATDDAQAILIGSSDLLENPYWLDAGAKVILVAIYKNRSADFYIFDDVAGRMIRKINADKSAEEFYYIKHSGNELYFQRKDEKNKYSLCIIDLESGKITETAPQNFMVKDVLWNEKQRYYGCVYVDNIRKSTLSLALPGTTLYLPLPEKQDESKKIAVLHDGILSSFWVAIYHPFSTGCSLYKYDWSGNYQKIDVVQPEVDHSEYYNQVYLSQYEDKIILEGNESYSKYVQIFDTRSGRRLYSTLTQTVTEPQIKKIQVIITNYLNGRKQHITTITPSKIDGQLDLVGGNKSSKIDKELTSSQQKELLNIIENLPFSQFKNEYNNSKVEDGTVIDFEFSVDDFHKKIVIANIYVPELGTLVAWIVKTLGQDYIWYDEQRVPWKEE